MKIKHLTCGLKNSTPIQIPDQSLDPHGLIAVLGSNGAGKTTLLKTLAGLLPPLQGEIDYTQKPLWFSTEFEWDLQLKVSDIFDLYEVKPSANIHAVAKEFAIDHLTRHRLQNISSGEKRRIALVIAICHDNPFIVMDEPTNFLEYRARILFAQYLNRLANHKRIIFSTHEVEWLAYLSQAHVWILSPPGLPVFLKNPFELVENSRLVPIFGCTFREAARSSSLRQKILYFEPFSAGDDGDPTTVMVKSTL